VIHSHSAAVLPFTITGTYNGLSPKLSFLPSDDESSR
jgi:hypothetical protein